jgi:hypothetical protein
VSLRFHLDENVDPAIALGLRHRGVDVTTTDEAGLAQASDQEQLTFARAEQRVLVTHDADFLRWHARRIPHSGIAYCPQRSRTIGDVVRALILLSECLAPQEMENHAEFL